MAEALSLPMRDMIKDMTLNIEVTGCKRASIRVHVGAWLMRFAARVMGVGASCIVVEMDQGIDRRHIGDMEKDGRCAICPGI